MVIIVGGLVLLAFLLLIGFAQDTSSVAEQAGPEALLIMGGVVVLAIVVLAGLWFGLKGRRVALVLLIPAGLVLTLLTANVYLGFESGLDRAEDVRFAVFFIAAIAAPVSMTTGAALRLMVSLLRPDQSDH